MSLSIIYTRASLGIQAPLVTTELTESTLKESKGRVHNPIINSHFGFSEKRIPKTYFSPYCPEKPRVKLNN